MTHPEAVLFAGERSFPALPACEHFAGNEKFIRKAFELQARLGPVFDVTCDCEDGAPTGAEREHAAMVARLVAGEDNHHGRAGARIHDPAHPASRDDIEVLIGEAGARIAYLTVAKPQSYDQAAAMVEHIHRRSTAAGVKAPPVHILIETQGALADVFRIAALPGVEALDFGLLDFVSDHRGAIADSAMRSPGQFEHRLVARAKAEVAAAALAHGRIPTHNPCLALDDAAAARADAARARMEFGFLRMYSIHPSQIEPIIEAMRPAAEDIGRAAEILLAAQAAGWGPIAHRSEMHDRASYRYFWDLLKRAHATGAVIPAPAVKAFFQQTH